MVLSKKDIRTLQERTRADLGTKWNPAALQKPRLPLLFGQVADRDELDHPATINAISHAPIPDGVTITKIEQDDDFITEDGLYVEDIPIKFPGTDFRIPAVIWHNFSGLLSQKIGIERAVNPALDDQYVYLTIQQGHVKPKTTQRPPGIHIDGFQKTSIMPQIVQHQISVCNALPTVFYAAAAQKNTLTLPKKEFFGALAKDAENGHIFRPPAYEIHMLNAYCPHRPDSENSADDKFRTFSRLSASSIPFMGSDNTRNPLFDYEWTPESKKAFYDSIAKPVTP